MSDKKLDGLLQWLAMNEAQQVSDPALQAVQSQIAARDMWGEMGQKNLVSEKAHELSALPFEQQAPAWLKRQGAVDNMIAKGDPGNFIAGSRHRHAQDQMLKDSRGNYNPQGLPQKGTLEWLAALTK